MPTEDKELILYEELADQIDKAIAEHKIELEKATEVIEELSSAVPKVVCKAGALLCKLAETILPGEEAMLIKFHPISRKCSISIIAACEEITLEMFERFLNSAHYLAEKMVNKDSGLLKTFNEKAIN